MKKRTANIQPAANRKGLRYEHPRRTHWRCIGGMSGSAIGSGKPTSSGSTSRVLIVCESKDSMRSISLMRRQVSNSDASDIGRKRAFRKAYFAGAGGTRPAGMENVLPVRKIYRPPGVRSDTSEHP